MRGCFGVSLSLLAVLMLAACTGPDEGGVILSAPDLSPAPTQPTVESPTPTTSPPTTPTPTPWPTPQSTALVLALAEAPVDRPTLSTENADRAESLAVLSGHTDTVNALIYRVDDTLLISIGADRTIHLWDTADGTALSTLAPVEPASSQPASSFYYDLAWPGGGERLYVTVGGGRGYAALWDGDLDNLPRVYWPFYPTRPGDDRAVYSPDGQFQASSSFRMNIGTNVDGLIHLEDGEGQSATLEGHNSYVTDLAFSPDGALLASTGNEQTFLWEVDRAQLIGALPGTMEHPAALRFSPDGERLYVVGYYGEVRAWAVETGDPAPAMVDEGPLHALEFAPGDPDLLAAGYADGTVRLWDMAAGTRLVTWTGHEAPVRLLAFSDDGRLLASADEGGTIRLWGVPAGSGP